MVKNKTEEQRGEHYNCEWFTFFDDARVIMFIIAVMLVIIGFCLGSLATQIIGDYKNVGIENVGNLN